MPKLFTRVEKNPIYIECYEPCGEIGLRLVSEKGEPINNGDFLIHLVLEGGGKI